MILAVMPFGVMAFFFYTVGNNMQLISYEITPLGWVVLLVIILGFGYLIFKRGRKGK